MPPRILLNCIIKNEMANLPRMLESVRKYVTAAVAIDTGSTDGSMTFFKEWCLKNNIKHQLVEAPFVNFEQARNLALYHAQKFHVGFDYILLMDADMELKVDSPLPDLTAESYTLLQRQGGLAYYNVRLLRKGSKAQYHGVTHEYLGVDQQDRLPGGDVYWFVDHATGSTRGEKYARDTRLLSDYLVDHPGDGRSLFYLAQTYRDAGDHEKAIELYKQRIAVGGWDEEVWYAALQVARAYRSLGKEAEFVTHALDAYNMRPSRAEPLYDLARYYREKDNQQQVGWLFAEVGSKIKYPQDMLFVEQDVYDWGFTEEKSILGAYNDKTKTIGFAAADKLSLMQKVPDGVREGARRNLYWYLQPLKTYAPSFTPVKIPEVNSNIHFTNSNPSVAVVDGKIKAIVRTVSYRIRQDGSYDYNGSAAIRTTNYLCDFDIHLKFEQAVELQRPTGFPYPVFKDILDVEDMRLIPWGGQLWANGCVLEQNPQAWREQFLMKLNPDTGEVTNWQRMEPQGIPKENQKNWMPILGMGTHDFMYKPGVTIDAEGRFIVKNETTLAVDQFSGGGQVIPFDAGYLAIVHEARPDPTNGKRFYQHRFVWFDQDYALQKVSKPFVFFDRQIEFAAGLAYGARYDSNIIISFGVLDREAWLASIDPHEVRDLLWHS